MIERSYHHGDLRTVLVRAALDLLAEDGADALSLRAVARRAGVSAMAPYRHYSDKEALIAAVATVGFEGLYHALCYADRSAAADQALVAQAVAYVRYAMENPSLFRLMFGPKRGGNHSDLATAGQVAYDLLAKRVAAETPVIADREPLTLGCWSLVHGLAMLFLDGRITANDTETTDDVTRRVAEAMLVACGGTVTS